MNTISQLTEKYTNDYSQNNNFLCFHMFYNSFVSTDRRVIMEKLSEYFKKDSWFYGDEKHLEWHVLYTQHRDSDILTRCNWNVICDTFKDSDNIEIIRCSHWAFGWLEYFIIRPNTEEYKQAIEIESSIEIYSVLNEEKLSEMEYDESIEIWNNCYTTPQERIDLLRTNGHCASDYKELYNAVKNGYCMIVENYSDMCYN